MTRDVPDARPVTAAACFLKQLPPHHRVLPLPASSSQQSRRRTLRERDEGGGRIIKIEQSDDDDDADEDDESESEESHEDKKKKSFFFPHVAFLTTARRTFIINNWGPPSPMKCHLLSRDMIEGVCRCFLCVYSLILRLTMVAQNFAGTRASSYAKAAKHRGYGFARWGLR